MKTLGLDHPFRQTLVAKIASNHSGFAIILALVAILAEKFLF